MHSIAKCFRVLRNFALSDEKVVRRQYRSRLGRELNLNNPKGFHEKICWLRLNTFTPLHAYCADKVTVAAYVHSRVGEGYTVPRFFMTPDVALLSPENIPTSSCVVKPNHLSQTVAIIEDTEEADWPEIRLQMAKSLKRNYYWSARERQYRYLKPVVIVEEKIDMAGVSPGEVNVYCLNGRAIFCLVFDEGAIVAKSPGVLVDRDFKPLHVTRQLHPIAGGSPPIPDRLSEIMKIAERLAEPFPLVRIDFLLGRSGFYVNELTFSPVAGYDRFIPESFELEMGSRINHNAPPPDWQHILASAKACESTALPPIR